jgi:hypothetical protein
MPLDSCSRDDQMGVGHLSPIKQLADQVGSLLSGVGPCDLELRGSEDASPVSADAPYYLAHTPLGPYSTTAQPGPEPTSHVGLSGAADLNGYIPACSSGGLQGCPDPSCCIANGPRYSEDRVAGQTFTATRERAANLVEGAIPLARGHAIRVPL